MNKKRILKSIISVILSLVIIITILPVTTINSKAAGVDDFVTRCYKVAFQRTPDKGGFDFWKNKILDSELVGSTVVYNFIFSKEYKEQKRTDKEFVNDLYTMFMGRKADKDGYNYWCGKISEGMSREDVFAGFANSPEFYDLCASYGISAGYFTNDYPMPQVNDVNLFVERQYKICLNRIGDPDGQKYWVEGLLNGTFTGSEIAYNYVFSEEYLNKGLSDEEFIKNLYKCCMGREFDQSGLEYWLEQKKLSNSNKYVFAGFVNSPEFTEICKKYNIKRGDYDSGIVVGPKRGTINVWSFTDEVPNMINEYLDNHPGFPYEIKTTIISTIDGAYQPALDMALASGDEYTPDIYTAEAAFVYKYAKGDMSGYAAPYSSLGIDINNAIKKAEIAQYTVDIGTNNSGQIVGLGYQSSASAFIYRRSVAKEIWGTDDPAIVKEKIGGGSGSWDKFWKAADEAKNKGFAICSGPDDIYDSVANMADKPWVVNGKLEIDPQREGFLDTAKNMYINNYTNNNYSWRSGWFEDMKGAGSREVLGYFGPAWFINYTLGQNCGYTNGDWAVTESPVSYYQGGTWIFASKNAIAQGKGQAIGELFYYITLDCSKDGLQYKWANGLGKYNVKDAVTSGTVMKLSDGKIDMLNGQNMFDIYVKSNQAVKGTNISAYDETINSFFKEQVDLYARGEKSRYDALKDFKRNVFENLNVKIY